MKGLKQNVEILHPGIEYTKMGYFHDKHTGLYTGFTNLDYL
ncbi:hypothetical protein LEP1GSC062_0958 [Leptospira alexanderi serovar Manhao 3 str. L 60]|uniref:Uncharacterized protein n=1 Tax=Leptospira alexanderi serovar Manhao 3 str. L 60 TaxID=1049759 RepID=V6HZR5_9LEPT|nr:hypothetical protein LEP1GSC062_0958 [Leptospira alexanderi serovar Manhao 3 str. L 60]